MSEPHPELQGADDDDPRGPVFGERRRRAIRVTVLVALCAMLLPIVLSIFGTAQSAAQRSCAVYAAQFDTDASGRPRLVRPLRPRRAGLAVLLGRRERHRRPSSPNSGCCPERLDRSTRPNATPEPSARPASRSPMALTRRREVS